MADLHRAGTTRRTARATAAVALVAAVTGCGSAGAGSSSSAVAHQISSGLGHQYGISAPPVSCPRAPKALTGAKAPTSFTCSASLDDQTLPLAVTFNPAADHAVWHPTEAVISTSAAVTQIDQRFGTQLGVPVKASCGSQPLRLVAPGATFSCATLVNGAPRTVTVTARDLSSNVYLELVPPATGPASSTPPVTLAPSPGTTAPPGTLPGD